MTESTLDLLRDIVAELERGELWLQSLKFERGTGRETVTTIVVTTAKQGAA